MSEEIIETTYELVDKHGVVIATGLTYEEYKKEMLTRYGVDVGEEQ